MAERGTRFPVIIYGPEGCGKTALLRQSAKIFESYGYAVIYYSPVEKELDSALYLSVGVRDVVKDVLAAIASFVGRDGFVHRVFELITKVMKFQRRVAILADDVFEAIGIEKAEIYVKALLNLIEYPPSRIDSVVVLVGSSEGLSRKAIERHSWARTVGMWNMTRNGFRQLYDQVPGDKPAFEDVWRWVGGNPRYLAKLYEAEWDPETVVEELAGKRELRLIAREWRRDLEEAVNDPDYLWEEYARLEEMVKRLVELNFIFENVPRREYLWIDEPPPERDPSLGIGREFSWQTPLHREAVRRVLEELSKR